MKLIYRILLPVSVVLSILLAGWSVLFYITVIDEIDDETDDALEHRAESIILRSLRGEEIPERTPGDNVSYFMVQIPDDKIEELPTDSYTDEDVYIHELGEEEPARVLRRVFRRADGKLYCLTVMIPTIEKVELRQTILWGMVALYVVALITILMVNIHVLRRALHPLQRLLLWLKGYSVGVTKGQIECRSDIREYRALYGATTDFAARAEQAFQRQKHFIDNAAHEMQTPLAVCRNRLEMLVDESDAMPPQAQLEEIGKVQRTLDHLVRLNRSLLLLSKIDNGQFPESEEVEMNTLIRNASEDFSEIYFRREMQSEVEEQGVLTLNINRSLAESLVSNLIKNAYVHGRAGGSIAIRVSPQGFEVENDGDAAPLDATQLFERFYQSSKKACSSGLGLSIVKAICRQYGFEASYSYAEGRHRFRISVGSQE